MSGQTADILNRYINFFFNLKGIIIADNEGINISKFIYIRNSYMQQFLNLIETLVIKTYPDICVINSSVESDRS